MSEEVRRRKCLVVDWSFSIHGLEGDVLAKEVFKEAFCGYCPIDWGNMLGMSQPSIKRVGVDLWVSVLAVVQAPGRYHSHKLEIPTQTLFKVVRQNGQPRRLSALPHEVLPWDQIPEVLDICSR